MSPIEFLKKVPKDFFSSLLLEDFSELATTAFDDENSDLLQQFLQGSTFTGFLFCFVPLVFHYLSHHLSSLAFYFLNLAGAGGQKYYWG